MQCPSCKTESLKPTRLDNTLPAHGCGQCGGVVISLLYYRDWAQRAFPAPLVEEPDVQIEKAAEQESHGALACPKCARLMTKFVISGRAKNRLDLCGSCDEAWLDGGEWQLLQALNLAQEIPTIFTDAWQRRVRHDLQEIKLKERFQKLVGDVDIAKAEDIRTWLKSHPKRAELLFYISQG